MQIETTRFGEIDVADEKIINFKDGLIGLEELTAFALISSEETWPFYWLQAVDDAGLALCVINPFTILPDYAPNVPQLALDELGIKEDSDVLLLTVAVVPQEVTKMTTNLAAPILINNVNNSASQVVLDTRDHELRHPIFSEVQALVEAGGQD